MRLFGMLVHTRCKAFTLVELVIVMFVIALLAGIGLASARHMFQQSHLGGADRAISNFLKIDKSRSTLYLKEFGILFYVDPKTHRQNMVVIKAMTGPELFCDEPNICGSPDCCYPIDETHPNVCSRYGIDMNNIAQFEFVNIVRVFPSDIFKCEEVDIDDVCIEYAWDDDDLMNDDYKAGRHRNFFILMYHPFTGKLSFPQAVIFDRDKNRDGNGDITELPVETVTGEAGGGIHYIVSDSEGEAVTFPAARGVAVYDEDLFQEFPLMSRPEYLRKQDKRVLMLTQTESVRTERS